MEVQFWQVDIRVGSVDHSGSGVGGDAGRDGNSDGR